jgi:hypothetical protein
VGFNFKKAFGRPVKIINDAAMQALGSYQGGRMLFLGLGTGLGSALIVANVLEPMELAHLPYRKGRSYEDYLGQAGLKRLGRTSGGTMSKKSLSDSRLRSKLTMLCLAAAMPGWSRSCRQPHVGEIMRMHSKEAIVFGRSVIVDPVVSVLTTDL